MPSRRGVVESIVGGLIVLLVLWAFSRIDASIPLWMLIGPLILALFVGYRAGTIKRHAELLSRFSAQHVTDIILTLRKILDGQLTGVSFEEFVERGILEPARLGLATVPGEEVRLSVLELDPASDEFKMSYAAGHSVGRTQEFQLSRGSMAGLAMQTGELQWTNDVNSDPRWQAHPEADPRRSYKSLVAMPVESGGAVVAVLNVVSSSVFLQSDLVYIELLGTVIGLAWVLDGGSAGAGT